MGRVLKVPTLQRSGLMVALDVTCGARTRVDFVAGRRGARAAAGAATRQSPTAGA